MTQNECYSNIHNPGSTGPGGPFGPCMLFNGTTNSSIMRQSNGTFPADAGAVDMLEVDAAYDRAVSDFMRHAVTEKKKPFFFYFASHHTHAPQFAPAALTNTSLRGLFGDSLAALDRSVGHALGQIATLSIENSTLVIFTADNGGSLQWGALGGVNGDLRCGKGTTYEGGVRVPTIIRWPGHVEAGSENQEIMSALDWFPTLGTLAGYVPAADVKHDGYDASGMLFGGKTSLRLENYYHQSVNSGSGELFAVRSGPYKLHFKTAGGIGSSVLEKNGFPDQACFAPRVEHTAAPILYNVQRDPGEVNAIKPSDPEYTAQAPRLAALAAAHLASFWTAPSQGARGTSPDRFPCCNPGCSPRPHCCKCPESGGGTTTAVQLAVPQTYEAVLPVADAAGPAATVAIATKAGVVGAASVAASKPNIVIIYADDLGHGDLQIYGHPTSKTPHLDRFARTGAKLEQHYSAANICSPSRGSLLTGRHYGRLGVYPGVFSPNSISGLLTNETTIAALLREQSGYTTGGLGKVGVGASCFGRRMPLLLLGACLLSSSRVHAFHLSPAAHSGTSARRSFIQPSTALTTTSARP